MDGWLRLKNILEATGKAEPPGVLFNVVVSPYDVPEAVRGFKVPGGRFRIEFRYIDGEEPGRQVPLDGHVTVTEGRHSHRLLALEVDVAAIGARSVGVAITPVESVKSQLRSAMDRVESMHGSSDENHARVRRALEARESELLQCLASGV